VTRPARRRRAVASLIARRNRALAGRSRAFEHADRKSPSRISRLQILVMQDFAVSVGAERAGY
jgi:hypothetical protein